MTPRRRRLLLVALAVLVVALIAAPAALASAGGGSSGFSDGGGGGGGGGNGFALFIIIDLLLHIAVLGHGLGALFLIAAALLYLFITKVLPRLIDWWAQQRAASAVPQTGAPPSASAGCSSPRPRPQTRTRHTPPTRSSQSATELFERDPASRGTTGDRRHPVAAGLAGADGRVGSPAG